MPEGGSIKNICIIRTNYIDRDPRLQKEIRAGKNFGYKILFLGWDRRKKASIKYFSEDNYEEKLFSLRAPFGPKIILSLPLWWIFELLQLIKLKPDLIHAINFDTIIPAIIYSKLFHKPIIYEIYDTYAHMNAPIPSWLRELLLYMDRVCIDFADLFIVVDKSRISEMGRISNKNIEILYNSPPDFFQENKKQEVSRDVFTIFYAGLLNEGRSIKEMIQVIEDIDNVRLIFAGYGKLVDDIKRAIDKNPKKIEYIGEISYSDVIHRSLSSDLLFSLYDPEIPLYKFASSNKLFEAMMCGKPILVSEKTSMAALVREHNCGLIIHAGDISEIKNAILTLKNNPSFCLLLGNNGRNAYLSFYNWSFMELKLKKIYHELLNAESDNGRL